MKPLAFASLFILSLSACGSPRDEDVLTQEKIRASESAPELPEINLSENPEPPPAAPPKEEPELNAADNTVENAVEIETQGSIPPAFQALWGRVPSDCRQGNVVDSGMLVSEDALIFADSASSLLGVLGDYPRRFIGRFGDESGLEQREELILTGSNVLIRTSGGQRLTYRRCIAPRPTG